MERLPARLQAIADELKTGGAVADIGLDHALLSIALVRSDRSRRVIGVENQRGPFDKAREAVEAAGLAARIDLRFGSGLCPLKPGEVDQVVIAGMGGETIVSILEEQLSRAGSYPGYIFQPMSRPECLRAFLSQQGWSIERESVVLEHGRYYVIITACPGGQPYRLDRLELDVGPYILKQRDQLSISFMGFMLGKLRTRLEGMRTARNHQFERQIHDILIEIEELEGRLNVLEG